MLWERHRGTEEGHSLAIHGELLKEVGSDLSPEGGVEVRQVENLGRTR